MNIPFLLSNWCHTSLYFLRVTSQPSITALRGFTFVGDWIAFFISFSKSLMKDTTYEGSSVSIPWRHPWPLLTWTSCEPCLSFLALPWLLLREPMLRIDKDVKPVRVDAHLLLVKTDAADAEEEVRRLCWFSAQSAKDLIKFRFQKFYEIVGLWACRQSRVIRWSSLASSLSCYEVSSSKTSLAMESGEENGPWFIKSKRSIIQGRLSR